MIMKKSVFALAALATIGMASCNSAETVEALEPQAIGFAAPFVDNATRATDPSYSSTNLPEAFNVWGTVTGTSGNAVAIYDGDAVTGTGLGTAWTATDTQYWIDGAKYNFAAVVGGEVATLSNGLPATISYTADGTSDLLYARSATDILGKASDNESVAFTFSHLLSKVNFTVTNTTVGNTNYKYSVTGINITSTPASGTYNVADGTWSGTGTYTTELGDITEVVNGTPKDCASEKLFIPGATSLTVEFTLNLYYGNELINSVAYTGNNAKTITLADGATFAAGNAYKINLSVGLGEEIMFTLNEFKWDEPTEITIP